MNISSAYSSITGGVASPPQTLSMITHDIQPRAESPRCEWALAYGRGWNTRCDHVDGHPRMHGGNGQQDWPYDYVQWIPGDTREFTTSRDDVYSWFIPL